MSPDPSLRLYAFSLPDPIPFEDYDALLTLLSPAEQARVQRYRLPEDRLRSLISRLGVWYHLLTTSLLSPRDPAPAFRSASRGKPYLATPLQREDGEAINVGFNTSHEGGWVILGVAEQEGRPSTLEIQATEIGVDVMVPPHDPSELKDVLIPQMTTPERLSLSIPLSSSQLRWTLTALWALKEGFTKAVGDGLSFGLERIQVDFGSTSVSPAGAGSGSDARHDQSPAGSSAPRGIRDSLPVLDVRVDGRDIRDDGWTFTLGSVGEGMNEVGYAMYWRTRRDEAESKKPEVEVVQWETFVKALDRVPSYAKRASAETSLSRKERVAAP